eukprot:2547921-Amphidinium_carterae.2
MGAALDLSLELFAMACTKTQLKVLQDPGGDDGVPSGSRHEIGTTLDNLPLWASFSALAPNVI